MIIVPGPQIGVSLVTQLSTFVLKIIHIQGQSHNFEWLFSQLKGTSPKEYNSLPPGANSIEENPFLERDVIDEKHRAIHYSAAAVRQK